MNKIYRIVFNVATGRWVVASEMAKGRKKAGSSASSTLRIVGNGAALTAILGGVLLASPAFAGVAITRQAVGGTTCEANSDDGNGAWFTGNQAFCHPPAGTGASGVGNPGTNIVMYSSTGALGSEDSITMGGYLDVWKTATLWGGANMQGSKITGLANGTAATDAVNFGQLTNATRYFHVQSAATDSSATGSDAIAIGGN
ncbi:MAG TPA: ESPR-type extended signal peptide-containing protein, partial [Lysobacter sp.]